MKTKFGAIIVDGRGKVGGHVASKNRGGSYIRTKVTPANARTSFQLTARAIMTFLSQQWRQLTDSQRSAWNAAVADFQKTDIFGDLRSPSGINLFVKLNANLNNIGVAMISEPPTPVAVGEVTAVSLTVETGTPSVLLVLSNAVPANTAVKVMATRPMSPGKSFVSNDFRLIGTIAAAGSSPVDLTSDYADKFGTVTANDQKISVKLIPVSMVSGQAGGTSQASTISITG